MVPTTMATAIPIRNGLERLFILRSRITCRLGHCTWNVELASRVPVVSRVAETIDRATLHRKTYPSADSDRRQL
jgi:hypothetical protein